MSDGVKRVDVAAIRARCAKATPGPWYCTGPVGQVMTGQWVAIADTWYEQPTENWEHNVAFIAAARTDVPALLAALDQAEASNARLAVEVNSEYGRALAEGVRRSHAESVLREVRRLIICTPDAELSARDAEIVRLANAVLPDPPLTREDYARDDAEIDALLARVTRAALGEAAPATREE